MQCVHGLSNRPPLPILTFLSRTVVWLSGLQALTSEPSSLVFFWLVWGKGGGRGWTFLPTSPRLRIRIRSRASKSISFAEQPASRSCVIFSTKHNVPTGLAGYC